MSEPAPVTPIRFNDLGNGWHLSPPRRFLRRGIVALAVFVLALAALGSVRDGNRAAGIGLGVIVLFILAIALERRASKSARMYESPTAYGLLLPTHPVKISLIALFAVLGAVLCLGPTLAVALGPGGGSLGEQIVAVVLCLLVGVVFVAGAVGGAASWRNPHRGILLTVDGVALQTQKPAATFAWHHCGGLSAHWTRVRSSGNHFLTPDDVIANWLTFAVESEHVVGRARRKVEAKTAEPTVDVKVLALDPALVLEVCRFYLDDAEARAELRTTSALDRVASIERALGTPS